MFYSQKMRVVIRIYFLRTNVKSWLDNLRRYFVLSQSIIFLKRELKSREGIALEFKTLKKLYSKNFDAHFPIRHFWHMRRSENSETLVQWLVSKWGKSQCRSTNKMFGGIFFFPLKHSFFPPRNTNYLMTINSLKDKNEY